MHRQNFNKTQIETSALIHNLKALQSLLGPQTAITAVVKADAYGHGMVRAARIFSEGGAQRLAVAHLNEALALRRAGIKPPIVLLRGILNRGEAEAVVEHDFISVLPEAETGVILNQESLRRGKRARVQLKIDTGMGRLGVAWSECGEFVARVLKLSGLHPEGLLSHLSSADEEDRSFSRIQIERFRSCLAAADAAGMETGASSLANSAGALWYPEARFGMVRPGIMLYGGSPAPELDLPVELRPAMSFKSLVIQIRDLPAHTPVSYGRTFVTSRATRVAVIAAGYGDGLPRALSNRGSVLIGGAKVPILGRVCMNLTMADISALPQVAPGDEAVFLGAQGKALLSGDEVAAAANTICYEIFCSLGRQGVYITGR